jgi:transcription initiation factor TFIIF subunit beta
MYLARVPNYLWEAWDKLPDDDQIQVGKIRQWFEVDPKTGQTVPRLRMLLDSGLAQHQLMPKEFDLKITEMTASNTFLFSEEDLPHFKERNRARAEATARGVPSKLLRQQKPDNKPAEKPRFTGGRRRGPRREFYRKAIPKKTKIAGRVRHEVSCIPVNNPETDHMMAMRAIEASKPTATVVYMDETTIPLSELQKGNLASQQRLQNFIVSSSSSSSSRMIVAGDRLPARWTTPPPEPTR